MNEHFEETRPYRDEEIAPAIRRMVEDEHFPVLLNLMGVSEENSETATHQLLQIKTIREFQVGVMQNVLKHILRTSTSGLTDSGFETLSDDRKCMFISNHRDIVLDSAFLQLVLYQHNLDTCEITFGSNLMKYPIFKEMGKCNKMFKLERGGTPKEIFKHSMEVSEYMRYAITQKGQSVWIAQHNGRCKTGDDRTENAVLKMFAMSSKCGFVENLEALNITPLSISYEYDPCDFLKTRELYISRRKAYVKAPNEDLMSILQGIKQWKGAVHLAVCPSITHEELEMCAQREKNDRFIHLAQLIDQRIHTHYRLHITNYIAYDLLHKTADYQQFYTDEERQKFLAYAQEGLSNIEGDFAELQEIFLRIYAFAVENAAKSASF